jgi:hypothetical protein
MIKLLVFLPQTVQFNKTDIRRQIVAFRFEHETRIFVRVSRALFIQVRCHQFADVLSEQIGVSFFLFAREVGR